MGLIIQGQTEQYQDDDNTLKLPAQTFVDAYVKYNLSPNLVLKLNVNNLFDADGISNSDQGSVADIRALGAAGGNAGVANVSPYQGRSVSAGISYVW